jgi:predicted nucleic acid-binding protein
VAPKFKSRIFLDSNVIFSGLYSPKGAPPIILERWLGGQITLVVSRQVLEEVICTIREKLPQALPALKRLLESVPPEVVLDPGDAETERWSKMLPGADAGLMAAAVIAQPDYFVTGDSHFLGNPAIARECGLQMVTPAQCLKKLESGERH